MSFLKRVPVGVAFALGVVISGAAHGAGEAPETDDENFREEVLLCEEAVARLDTCCPDIDWSTVACNYRHTSTGGCTNGTADFEDPTFKLEESRCILDTSCSDIHARGVCTRAKAAQPYITKARRDQDVTTDLGSTTHPPVCP